MPRMQLGIPCLRCGEGDVTDQSHVTYFLCTDEEGSFLALGMAGECRKCRKTHEKRWEEIRKEVGK